MKARLRKTWSAYSERYKGFRITQQFDGFWNISAYTRTRDRVDHIGTTKTVEEARAVIDQLPPNDA